MGIVDIGCIAGTGCIAGIASKMIYLGEEEEEEELASFKQ